MNRSAPNLNQKEHQRERNRTLLDRIVTGQRAQQVLLAIVVLYTLYFARGLFLPIFIALLIAAFLQPFVEKLNRLKIPEIIGAGVVVVLFATAILFTVYKLSTPATIWLNRGSEAFKDVEIKLSALKESIRAAKETTERLERVTEIEPQKDSQVVVKGPSLGQKILGHASSVLSSGIITFILAFFLLARGRAMLAHVVRGLRYPDQGEKFTELLLRLQQEISYYLRVITIINLSFGATVGIAMAAVGMPSPVLWAVVASVLNFVPYLGPAATFVIVSVVSLLTFETWQRIILPPIVYAILRTFEGEVITPLVLGNRLSINPIMIFLAILYWGWVWGIPGIFLAVPTLVTLRVFTNHIDSLKPFRGLLN